MRTDSCDSPAPPSPHRRAAVAAAPSPCDTSPRKGAGGRAVGAASEEKCECRSLHGEGGPTPAKPEEGRVGESDTPTLPASMAHDPRLPHPGRFAACPSP